MPDIADGILNQLVDWVIGKSDPLPAAGSRYVALFDGDPQAAGTEVTTTIRSAGRVAITSSMEAAGTTTTGESASTADIDFGNAENGATVSHIAIYDSASGGTLLASDVLTGGTQTITAGNPVKIPAGDLKIAIA
ncbi:phage tail fiber protein [Dichotomicrobium thermohalophilum]|uniref:Uncharacterized protein n=1 Tax=Dichotomicrobium thermohalophilum TaxID=933063 RepID=A0A397QB99_9HYPH|nr:hypothetical protein [Dichotomicrobium thermohalophilum]RIA56757.1 hypothetical protein BXY53_1867 [Dichotomicrobium thermohalophilum]